MSVAVFINLYAHIVVMLVCGFGLIAAAVKMFRSVCQKEYVNFPDIEAQEIRDRDYKRRCMSHIRGKS
jgi:hypothetical protein